MNICSVGKIIAFHESVTELFKGLPTSRGPNIHLIGAIGISEAIKME